MPTDLENSSDGAIEALVRAAAGIDIAPELLARVPEAVGYVNAWRKTLIDNGSLREESPTNEFLGVVTIAATWAVNGVIAARVRAEVVADERQRIATEIEAAMPPSARYMPRDTYNGMCDAYRHAVSIVRAAGSVPIATPPDYFVITVEADGSLTTAPGPVATPTEPARAAIRTPSEAEVLVTRAAIAAGLASPVPAVQPSFCGHTDAEGCTGHGDF